MLKLKRAKIPETYANENKANLKPVPQLYLSEF